MSYRQIGVLLFVFMTGSSTINIPGTLIGKAGNGAWLSLLLSGFGGLCMLLMLLFLNRRFPDLSYVDYSREIIGNFLTVLFGLLSITFILQMESAIVVDIGLFMVSSMLRETPMYAFTFLIFLIAGLTARAGIEIMARMFTLLMLLSTLSVFIVLAMGLPDYHANFLLPILPKGFKPVIHGAVFTFGFPFVEIFLFGMLLQYVNVGERKLIPKSMIIALAASLLTLLLSTISGILVFGDYAADKPYSLFAVARIVEFQEIIQRIESIIGISLILGSFMKATITIYVFSMFAGRLFRLKDCSVLVMPLALIGFLMGLVTFDSISQWGNMVTVVHPVWTAAVFSFPLLLVTLSAILRGKRQIP
nr:GerAB/ArcD/ProY family transporter [Paenibacillus sp. HB172176]